MKPTPATEHRCTGGGYEPWGLIYGWEGLYSAHYKDRARERYHDVGS